jgi:hypothetical protein
MSRILRDGERWTMIDQDPEWVVVATPFSGRRTTKASTSKSKATEITQQGASKTDWSPANSSSKSMGAHHSPAKEEYHADRESATVRDFPSPSRHAVTAAESKSKKDAPTTSVSS